MKELITLCHPVCLGTPSLFLNFTGNVRIT